MEKIEITEFFNKYYSDYIVECSDIIFSKVNEALKMINDKHGLMEINDAYRAISYATLKVLSGSFSEPLTNELSIDINKKAADMVDNIVKKHVDTEHGKEIVYTLPIIMMDVLAFKEFEYNYAKKMEEKDNE